MNNIISSWPDPLDRAAARRLAKDYRQQPNLDPTHGLVLPRRDPIALALQGADLHWSELYGWPVKASQSDDYEAWRQLVHAEAFALQQRDA